MCSKVRLQVRTLVVSFLTVLVMTYMTSSSASNFQIFCDSRTFNFTFRCGCNGTIFIKHLAFAVTILMMHWTMVHNYELYDGKNRRTARRKWRRRHILLVRCVWIRIFGLCRLLRCFVHCEHFPQRLRLLGCRFSCDVVLRSFWWSNFAFLFFNGYCLAF